jgi:hypothetical protein
MSVPELFRTIASSPAPGTVPPFQQKLLLQMSALPQPVLLLFQVAEKALEKKPSPKAVTIDM